ncbi:MAG: hypothetical protein M0Z90_11085 [Desulfobacteraceae bacterium]|nr:hypothetical protein [Desulfobacteraceae bacterium]
MIQDFSSVFVVKQTVRARTVPIRGNLAARRLFGSVMVAGLGLAIVASLACGMLIRAGQRELAEQNAFKQKLIKEQEHLYGQRGALLDQNSLVAAAGKLGLYLPETGQVRHL